MATIGLKQRSFFFFQFYDVAQVMNINKNI
jgi:hypothetical protein